MTQSVVYRHALRPIDRVLPNAQRWLGDGVAAIDRSAAELAIIEPQTDAMYARGQSQRLFEGCVAPEAIRARRGPGGDRETVDEHFVAR